MVSPGVGVHGRSLPAGVWGVPIHLFPLAACGCESKKKGRAGHPTSQANLKDSG